jgi:hypothetical protein
MAIVTEISWDDMLDGKPLPETPARQAWREAVAEIADKAKAKLPECSGRVDSAIKIVLAGDVALQADGTARVASQFHGSMAYQVVNGHCDCQDFAKAPHHLCQHRLSAAIVRRAHELTKQRLAQLEDVQHGTSQPPPEPSQVQPQSETVSALPEAPASANCHILMEGRQVHVTLRDTDETRLLTRLATLLRQYPLAQPLPHDTRPPTPTPVCLWHGAMKESTKAKGTWYCPAKMADGSYCKSRHPEKGT